MREYFATMRMSASERLGGGIWPVLGEVLLRFVYVIPLLFLWKSLYAHAPQPEMGLSQALAYAVASSALKEVFQPQSPMCSFMYEGSIIDMYRRPMGIFGQLIAQTVGGWLPMLALYSLPAMGIFGLLGISMAPASPWFFASLILTVSLGFAVDFLFATLMIRMMHISYLVYMIRHALTALFSGALVPFALMPFGLGPLFASMPLGSLSGAPLSLLVGTGQPGFVIGTQLFWNAALWPLVIWLFQHSRERMVSHGG